MNYTNKTAVHSFDVKSLSLSMLINSNFSIRGPVLTFELIDNDLLEWDSMSYQKIN